MGERSRTAQWKSGSVFILVIIIMATIMTAGCGEKTETTAYLPAGSLISSIAENPDSAQASIDLAQLGGTRHFAQSVIMKAPGSLEWKMTIPQNEPVLEFLLGYRLNELSKPGYARCTITVSGAAGEATVFEHRFWANRDFSALESQSSSVSLADFAGQDVVITFGCNALSEDIGELEVAWGNPVIYEKRPQTRPNIVLICVDTLRADKYQPMAPDYKYTPNLAALAADSVLFENTISQAPWTLPSVSTVMTGLTPGLHGAGKRIPLGEDITPQEVNRLREERGFVYTFQTPEKTYVYGINGLRDDVLTIPEFLGDNYTSHMVNSNAFLSDASNLVSRFATFHDYVYPAFPGFMVAQFANNWIEDNADKQFFLYVHFMDVHEWETRAADTTSRDRENPEFRQRAITAYDEMVDLTDHYVGTIIARLKEKGLYDDSVIIFYSDHGEHMWDDPREMFGHGNSLSNILLHVPMTVKFPKSMYKGTRISDYVGLIDIFPTILDFAGLEFESPIEGNLVSLKAIADGTKSSTNRTLVSEFTVFNAEQMAVQQKTRRLIHNITADNYRMVEAGTDERIGHNKRTETETYDLLMSFMQSYREMVEKLAKEPVMMSLERKNFSRFKDLGYIQ